MMLCNTTITGKQIQGMPRRAKVDDPLLKTKDCQGALLDRPDLRAPSKTVNVPVTKAYGGGGCDENPWSDEGGGVTTCMLSSHSNKKRKGGNAEERVGAGNPL